MNMKETFGAYIRERVPSLWREVTRAKIDAAAVFSWPVARVSALEFRGSKDTPCGCVGGPMLDVVDRISHHLDREAWHGLCPSQQERCGGTEILWVRPHLGDPPGLGVRLSITAASFAGRTYQPRPHWPEGQAYGRVLTEKAAETGDVAAMLRAAQQFGLDDPRDYLGALWQAASRGEHKFIRALVQLVGLDFVGDGYYSWMHAGAATRGHRSVIYALLKSGLPFPSSRRQTLVSWAASGRRFSASFVGNVFLTRICKSCLHMAIITTPSVVNEGLLVAAKNPKLVKFMVTHGAAPAIAFCLKNPVDLFERARWIASKFDLCEKLVAIAPQIKGGKAAKASWLKMFSRVANSWKPSRRGSKDAAHYNQTLASVHRRFIHLASNDFEHVPTNSVTALML